MGSYGPTGVGTLLFSGVDGSLQIQRLNPFLSARTSANDANSKRADKPLAADVQEAVE